MSDTLTASTSLGRSRRMVSPVEFKKERDTAEVQNNISPRENGHGFSDTFTNSVGSSISMPRIDSHILGKETLEQREKFTLYKIEVNNGQKSWIIYRRYGDFVLLNKKLRRLFPEFRLHLPGKRFFKDNFDEGFIDKRQRGLEVFTNNLFGHRNLVLSDPVQRFYRLNNPPQPSENLEACQDYCQSLEHTLADLRQQLRDQTTELNSLKTELARVSYYRDENQHLNQNLQQQQTNVEQVTKRLQDQLNIALENERRAKEEVETLKEEMKAERASVQAARVIEKQKNEVGIKRQMDMFKQSQEAVNQRVDSLVHNLGQLSRIEFEIFGVKHEYKTDEGIQNKAVQLRKALTETRSQLDKMYKNSLEMYQQEVEDLKAELSRADYLAKTKIQEAESLRAQMSDLHKRYQDIRKAQDDYISDLLSKFNDLQRYAVSTEEKYFFSLVIGVKLNMGICGYRVHHLNHLKPPKLFEQVQNLGYSIEHWPSWLSRTLSTASSSLDPEDED
ncbi:kinesin-related protein 1-like [Stylophora pistillata]|uniref:Sorting nexin-16 n=1 Tax=Stylophora pistillata TaxID=50429 RepID=A0A2B4SS14_STYPI|nr:kinesin-related protein 1-like [Stylophora pistillata]PFX31368.1 Sorting nexin-16 [Stylophora pistillata]